MGDSRYAAAEISVAEAEAQCCPNRPLIDIRDADERLAGVPHGSVPMSANELLEHCLNSHSGIDTAGFVICSEGVRSRKAVETLIKRGFNGFVSVSGGFRAWQDAGLPVGYPPGLEPAQAQRYARHLVMPQVGPEGQRRLMESRMLLVGLGGLNSPAALYLAAAGVGRLGLVDDDRVERSNLQRQVIHGEGAIHSNKAFSASQRIGNLNPEIETEVFDLRIDESNARDLVRDWDIVVDGTDNFPARYALNDACVEHSKPLVYGAVMRFQGQVSVFQSAPCFRCMMPEAPSSDEAPGCAEAGVLGVLPGIVGTLQANEALKLALGIGKPLLGKLLMIDALNMDFRQARISPNPDCRVCGSG